MRTENLRINQLPAEAFQWYADYLEAIDAKDLQRHGSFLAETYQASVRRAKQGRGENR